MIFVTGDTHGDFSRFDAKYFEDEPCYLIVCGDFGGIWDGSESERSLLDRLEEKKFTLLFVDGNHENFDLPGAYPVTEWYGGKVRLIRRNIIYLMRGQVFTVQGLRFFTFGGGQSHDIDAGGLSRADPDFAAKKRKLDDAGTFCRIDRESWWKEELPDEEEMREGFSNLETIKRSPTSIGF